jgi:ADP-ribose pyrophosphatase
VTNRTDKRTVWEGRHLKVLVRGHWEFIERRNVTGIVCIVAVTDDRKLVLVEQYRPPVDARVVELPAGLVGDVPGQAHEPLEAAARRELLEETGYEAQRLEVLFEGAPSAGLSNEHITFFLATGLRKVASGGGDESEDIAVHEVPLEDLLSFLQRRGDAGAVVDAKILSPLYVYRHREGR